VKDFENFEQQAISSEVPKLTHQEIDHYVDTHQRNMASLLSALRLSGDEAYLTEAIVRFPNHPQALMGALERTGDPSKRLEILPGHQRSLHGWRRSNNRENRWSRNPKRQKTARAGNLARRGLGTLFRPGENSWRAARERLVIGRTSGSLTL
jgi:hypothetical protein